MHRRIRRRAMLRAALAAAATTLPLAPRAAFARQEGLPPPPPSDVVSARRAAALRETIAAQLDALRRGDHAAAFGFASPVIRRRFVHAENFARMVARGYPVMLEPARPIFGALMRDSGRLRQRVTLLDERGLPWEIDYLLIEAEGGWRIDGVELRRARGRTI